MQVNKHCSFNHLWVIPPPLGIHFPYRQFIQPDKLHLPVTGPYIFVTFLKKNLTLNFQAPRTYLIVKVRLLLVRLARFELARIPPADFKSAMSADSITAACYLIPILF